MLQFHVFVDVSKSEMSEFWEQLRGRIIGDRYVLGDVIGATVGGASYWAEGSGSPVCVLKLRVAGQPEDAPSGNWLAAVELSHPNLIQVVEAGTAELDGQPVDYIVMERADETLASVLEERALSESETRDMLAPALAAVGFLHQKGFVHGQISPSNVMAVGETLKVSPDHLLRVGSTPSTRIPTPYDAPEVPNSAADPASDSWSIGALVLKCLTLHFPEVRDGEVALPELAAPFMVIAKNALRMAPRDRWTVEEIVDVLEGRRQPVRKLPTESATQPPTQPAKPRVLAALPPVAAKGVEKQSRLPDWRAFGIGVAAVLLILILWVGRKPDHSAAKNVGPVVPTTEAGDARPPLSPAIPPVLPQATRPLVKGRASGSWYVVVATYASKSDAEKRARAIESRWPKFHTRVFEPPVRDPHPLVVIGSNLSEDEADSLRKRARAAGLPQDVYIKRFAR